MLAKLTVKNQLTLPKAVVSRFKDVQYFDVTSEGESIILRPLRESRADQVREQLASLGIVEDDVTEAVAWARESK
jgi:bifunctional DNA-binding transcriptional regulator/antitoxin component of YhaV-PrlF toxin-antitoxin module